jgi:hypothetical protein
MKPADRSLDITVLGLGRAGGNIAAEFHRRGYRALAFNNAKSDLAALGSGALALPDAQRIYIGTDGSDAAGSDVDHGRECIAVHAEEIRAAVAEHAASADLVVVAAGLGGGIGSCTPELVALLHEQGVPIVALTALPHHHESGLAKVNALCAIRDLAQARPFGWVMIDDAKLARLHRDVPINAYFETINRAIVEPLDAWNRLNERDSAVPIRALGSEDLRTLLLAGGILCFHARELAKLSALDVIDTVRTGLADNPIMPSGSELADVAYLGLVIEAPEAVLAQIPFSLCEEIAEQAKRETGGAAVYLGLYRASAVEGAAATVRVLACARALPASIGELTAEAQREADAISQKASQQVGGLDLGGLERLRPALAPRARAARRSEPSAEPREATPAAAPAAASATGAIPRNGSSAGPPSRGRYERLANAFRDASGDEERARIADELVAAQQSSDALERFYAVNAMARVDPAHFRDALRSAARDADRHVSDLARRALEKLARS